MNLPLVSIVVPSYNHGHFIGKMIESVISQTYENWELIIVDNHSSDDTDIIINNYNDKRIKVFKIFNNGIVAVSRNKGILEANGLWVAFLDSDDGWYPEKLEICMSSSEHADLIYHNMKLYKAQEDIFLTKGLVSRKVNSPIFKDLLIRGNTIINSSVIVKKSLLEVVNGINENREIITSEDYHLWLKISQVTDRFLHLPKQLGYYTIHGQGLSQRDTSTQLRYAVSEFLSVLSDVEKKYVESFIRYSRIRTLIMTKQKNNFLNDVFYCLFHGAFDIKMKSLFSAFQLVFLFSKK
jgi:glycosyltransferase involved in cell wall biosynthesis